MKKYNDQAPDSFRAFLVDEAQFTPEEEYPLIPSSAVPLDPPKQVMAFNRAISYKGDLSQTAIHFYAPDARFERVRRNPKRYLSFFQRTAGIIGFDFSVHSDMPLVLQKSQLNDNLSLSYFYAAHGVKVYPNIRPGSDAVLADYLKAFPTGAILAIGVHGFTKLKSLQHEWVVLLETIRVQLKPRGIIVVGTLPKDIRSEFEKDIPFYFFGSTLDQLIKEGKSYVNKRRKQ